MAVRKLSVEQQRIFFAGDFEREEHFPLPTAVESIETTPERSDLMRRVRREHTEPEQIVRRVLWDTGARYRLHVSDLPGSPDIANKKRHLAIFVHGCFWHFHQDCERGVIPKRNREFWSKKLRANRARDRRKVEALRDLGFSVQVIWECELDDLSALRCRLQEFWFNDDA